VSCGVLHFFSDAFKTKGDRLDDITVHQIKAHSLPSDKPPTTDLFTRYVVVVAVVLDNLGALIPASSYPGRIFRSTIDRVT
jgi:hypothetical protein